MRDGGAVAKPLQAQALLAKLVVETLVGRVLPRLSRIEVGSVDVDVSQPLQDRQDRPGDERRPSEAVRVDIAVSAPQFSEPEPSAYAAFGTRV